MLGIKGCEKLRLYRVNKGIEKLHSENNKLKEEIKVLKSQKLDLSNKFKEKDSLNRILDGEISKLSYMITHTNVSEKVVILREQLSKPEFSSSKEVNEVIKDSTLSNGVEISILQDSSIKINPIGLSLIVTGLKEKDLLISKVSNLSSQVDYLKKINEIQQEESKKEVQILSNGFEVEKVGWNEERRELKKEIKGLKFKNTGLKLLSGAGVLTILYLIVK